MNDHHRPVQQQLAAGAESASGGPRSESGAPEGGEALTDRFSAAEIFRRVAATADSEFQRTPRMLFFSGVAAGISLGIAFLARSALHGAIAPSESVVGDLLYPIGFVIVVLGGYQLFTENTLTPVTLVLARLASIPSLLRLWAIVLLANLVGAGAAAALFAVPDALSRSTRSAADELTAQILSEPASLLFVRAVIAGVLVASMVWLVHAVREGTARILIAYGLMLLVPLAGLYHCITSFTEVTYGLFRGNATVGAALVVLAAVVLGNTVGGVALVAVINFGQSDEKRSSRESGERLTWREVILSTRLKRQRGGSVAPELDH